MVDVYTTLAHHGMGIEEAVVSISALPDDQVPGGSIESETLRNYREEDSHEAESGTALIGGFTVQVGDRLMDASSPDSCRH